MSLVETNKDLELCLSSNYLGPTDSGLVILSVSYPA